MNTTSADEDLDLDAFSPPIGSKVGTVSVVKFSGFVSSCDCTFVTSEFSFDDFSGEVCSCDSGFHSSVGAIWTSSLIVVWHSTVVSCSLAGETDFDLLLAGDRLFSEDRPPLELDLDLDVRVWDFELDRLLLAFSFFLPSFGEGAFA